MTHRAVRVAKIVLGAGCLVLGVVGLFFPFLQGILFLIIGLTLLGGESEFARRLLTWLGQGVSVRVSDKGEQ